MRCRPRLAEIFEFARCVLVERRAIHKLNSSPGGVFVRALSGSSPVRRSLLGKRLRTFFGIIGTEDFLL